MKRRLTKIAAAMAVAALMAGNTTQTALAYNTNQVKAAAQSVWCNPDGSCDVNGVCINGGVCDGSHCVINDISGNTTSVLNGSGNANAVAQKTWCNPDGSCDVNGVCINGGVCDGSHGWETYTYDDSDHHEENYYDGGYHHEEYNDDGGYHHEEYYDDSNYHHEESYHHEEEPHYDSGSGHHGGGHHGGGHH